MKKTLLFIILGISLIGIFCLFLMRSPYFGAGDVKSIAYKDNNMAVEFLSNNTKVGQATLKSHKTYDEVLAIPSGKDRTVIWYEFSFNDIQKDALMGVEFIDMRELVAGKTEDDPAIPNPNYGLPVSKEYKFVYLENGKWVDYNSTDISKNITLGVKTDLAWGEKIDVRLNIMGSSLDRHAVTWGTSAGFVSSSPVNDPAGTNTSVMEQYGHAVKDVSPATATKVTEIGFWSDADVGDTNFEVAIYDHDAVNDRPGNLVGVSRTNAKGTGAGWKKATVDITISPSTTYWIAHQVDTLDGEVVVGNYSIISGKKHDRIDGVLTLPDPWGASATTNTSILAIYAVWEAASGASTCYYSGTGNWDVLQSDNCYATTTQYIEGEFNLIGNAGGTGSFGCAPNVKVSATAFNLGTGKTHFELDCFAHH